MSVPSINYTAWEFKGRVEPMGRNPRPSFYLMVRVKFARDIRTALTQADRVCVAMVGGPARFNVISVKRDGWRGTSPSFT